MRAAEGECEVASICRYSRAFYCMWTDGRPADGPCAHDSDAREGYLEIRDGWWTHLRTVTVTMAILASMRNGTAAVLADSKFLSWQRQKSRLGGCQIFICRLYRCAASRGRTASKGSFAKAGRCVMSLFRQQYLDVSRMDT